MIGIKLWYVDSGLLDPYRKYAALNISIFILITKPLTTTRLPLALPAIKYVNYSHLCVFNQRELTAYPGVSQLRSGAPPYLRRAPFPTMPKVAATILWLLAATAVGTDACQCRLF